MADANDRLVVVKIGGSAITEKQCLEVVKPESLGVLPCPAQHL